jgi:hypothetical protein
LLAKDLYHARNNLSDERVGLFDGRARLVHEARLNRVPTTAESVCLVVMKQGGTLAILLALGRRWFRRPLVWIL